MGRHGARKRWFGRLLAAAVALVLAVLGTSLYVGARYTHRIVPLEAAPAAPVALVFGAGLAANGVPSPVLAERLDAAVALYKAGRVRSLLVSGDNSDRYHDETRAMRRYVVGKGVPQEAVDGDFAGLSTYDTCVRARNVFGVREALLVTQRFHLPRALYIANSVGIDAHGVAADAHRAGTRRYLVRETLSRPLALAMVLLEVEPTYPSGRAAPASRPAD